MLRRPRRVVLGLSSLVLALALAGCGSDSGDAAAGTAERLDAVTISGDPGTAPTVDWKSKMTAGSVETETLDEGDGPEVAAGDSVLTQLWIGNGVTEAKAFSSYETAAELITLDDSLSPVFTEAIEGHTIGSRVAVTASADEAFGPTGNSALGIGNKDSVLLVVDLVSGVADEPSGTRADAPDWMPAVKFAKGEPASFDFKGIATPATKFRKATLIAGDGPAVEKGQTVVASYLGQVYRGAKPFDENFTKTPTAFSLNSVVKGWGQGLVGVTVGSRVVLQVPPKLGYGAAGNQQAGIKGTDTLFFVIDVLAAG